MRVEILDQNQKPIVFGLPTNIGQLEDYTNKITGKSDPRFVCKTNKNRWLHLSTIREIHPGSMIKNLDIGEMTSL